MFNDMDMDILTKLTEGVSSAVPEKPKDKTFTTGKYQGRTHKFVCTIDPNYILHVYENFMDHGGISNEMYRLAEVLIQEATEEEQDDIDWLSDSDEEDYDQEF